MAEQVIIKVGNSLAVTIPANFAKQVGLQAGQEIMITSLPEEGKIIVDFPKRLQLPLA